MRASTVPLSYYISSTFYHSPHRGEHAGKGVKAPQRGLNLLSCLHVFLAWGTRGGRDQERSRWGCRPWGPFAERGHSMATSQALSVVTRLGWKMANNPHQACSRRLTQSLGRVRLAAEGPSLSPQKKNRPLGAACAGPGATVEIRAMIDLQNAINCLGQEAD